MPALQLASCESVWELPGWSSHFGLFEKEPIMELAWVLCFQDSAYRHLRGREYLGGEKPRKKLRTSQGSRTGWCQTLPCTQPLLPGFFLSHGNYLPGCPTASLSSGFQQVHLPRLSATTLNLPVKTVQVRVPLCGTCAHTVWGRKLSSVPKYSMIVKKLPAQFGSWFARGHKELLRSSALQPRKVLPLAQSRHLLAEQNIARS